MVVEVTHKKNEDMISIFFARAVEVELPHGSARFVAKYMALWRTPAGCVAALESPDIEEIFVSCMGERKLTLPEMLAHLFWRDL